MQFTVGRIGFAAVLFSTTLSACIGPPGGEAVDFGSIDSVVTTSMIDHGVPGVSIAIIDDFEVVYVKGFGEAEPGRLVTSDTLFQAASLTKPVAALVAGAASEEGLLDLDADINDMLTSWRLPPSAYDQTITLRMLLAHRAGLNVSGFPGYRLDEPIPGTVQILRGVRDKNEPIRVVDEPGARRQYSGGGFVLAQLAIEEATGRPFEELSATLLFEPLDLRLSTLELLDEEARRRVAVGYRADGAEVAGGGWHLYPEGAAGSMWTTPTEYGMIVADVMRSHADDTGVLLDGATVSTLLDPDFAVGFGISREEGGIAIAHEGANEGYRCEFLALPHLGQGVVVMTNSDSGLALTEIVIDEVADLFDWPWTGFSTPLWAVLAALGVLAVTVWWGVSRLRLQAD